MSENGLGDDGAIRISQALMKNKNLRRIKLNSIINYNSLQQLTTDNSIGNIGALQLALLVAQNTNIVDLDISGIYYIAHQNLITNLR